LFACRSASRVPARGADFRQCQSLSPASIGFDQSPLVYVPVARLRQAVGCLTPRNPRSAILRRCRTMRTG
jgi:hypothetical protein